MMRAGLRGRYLLAVLTTVVAAARAVATDPCDAPGASCTMPVGAVQCYEVKPSAFPPRR